MTFDNSSGEGAMTDERAEVLVRSGVMTAHELADAPASVARGDPDDFERLAAQHATFRGEPRFATWQVTADPRRPVRRGLVHCITAIPGASHPATLLGSTTTVQDDVDVEEQPATPPTSLVSVDDPQTIRDA